MKKARKKGLWTIAAMFLIVGVVFLPDIIPANENIKKLGKKIIVSKTLYAGSGQEQSAMVASFFGGQIYWESDAADEEKFALEENKRENELPPNKETNIRGDVSTINETDVVTAASITVRQTNETVKRLKETLDTDYLWQKFYIVDSTTSVTKKLFPVKELLQRDMTIKKDKTKKQILIYHTHGGSEYFANSKKGEISDSVVGVGDELTKELEKLGYGVIHDRRRYDIINGSLDRSLAYNKSLAALEKNLKEKPEIQVVIDLHRDSVGRGKHTYTKINGKKTAIVMFFNGLSRTKSGPIAYLYNKNLTGNLSFSLQMKCAAMEYFEGFTKPIYLKGYRYNLHMRERSLLIELGNENNTVEEAKAATAPLAQVLDRVLTVR